MKNRLRIFFLILGLMGVNISGISCDQDSQGYQVSQRPVQEIIREETGGGLVSWGSGGEYMYGLSGGGSGVFQVWKWEKYIVQKYKQIVLNERTNTVAWFGVNYYILPPIRESKKDYIIINDDLRHEIIKEWTLENGWYCNHLQIARTGKYISICLFENYVSKPEGYDWDHPRVRLGVIGLEPNEIKWYPTLRGYRNGQNLIRKIAVSDDGNYVAVAGWDNGAAVVDGVNNKILWEKNVREFKDEAMLRDITFSPDNKYIYTGGTAGCVYKVDLPTGKILDTWWATESGEPVYGYRINSVAASADGRFVAAGTAPTGITYIWAAETGKVVNILNHGSGILMIMFSPNSQALATFDGGSIKIWKMPDLSNKEVSEPNIIKN